MNAAILLSDPGFLALISEHIARSLPPERIEAIAERMIDTRIGVLTLEQARARLQCKTIRQLTDFLRAIGVKIQNHGKKKRFVLLADIQRAQKAASIHPPDPSAPRGTRIAALPPAALRK